MKNRNYNEYNIKNIIILFGNNRQTKQRYQMNDREKHVDRIKSIGMEKKSNQERVIMLLSKRVTISAV